MQKWEYKYVNIDLDLDMSLEIFNDEGQDGWELVSITHLTDGLVGIFKRPT